MSIFLVIILSFSILNSLPAYATQSALQAGQFSIPALAQVTQQVTLTYPIPQLGNCRDAKECYWYCAIPQNQPACQNFSRSRQLNRVLGASTLPNYQTIAQKYGITYPIKELNNCPDHYSCKSYCNFPKNYSTCTAFAKNHNLLSTNH